MRGLRSSCSLHQLEATMIVATSDGHSSARPGRCVVRWLGAGRRDRSTSLWRTARTKLHDDRAPARAPELDHVRLPVGMASAPAQLHTATKVRRLTPITRPARALRRPPAEAAPVRRARGSTTSGLRARPDGCRPRSSTGSVAPRRPAPAAGRLALPPASNPFIPPRCGRDRLAVTRRARGRPACATSSSATTSEPLDPPR